MNSINDIVQFCQEQADFHGKQARRCAEKPERQNRHLKLVAKFMEAVTFLQANPAGSPDEPAQADLFRIDPYDVSDLPPELVDELTIPKSDNDEVRTVTLLRIAARPLSINEIMVGLYRKFGEVQKRTTVNARLYRMVTKGDLVSPEKGVYALSDNLKPATVVAAGSEGGSE